MTTFVPSPQQQDVYEWVSRGTGSALLEAVAGSGKTTTLVGAMSRMRGSVLFLAYNRHIATTIQERLDAMTLPVHVRARASTFHSVGWGAWRRRYPACRLIKESNRKTFDILRTLKVPDHLANFVAGNVDYAKQTGIGIIHQISDPAPWYANIEQYDLAELIDDCGSEDRAIEEGVEWSMQALDASAAQCPEAVDFNDQLWAPLRFPTFLYQQDWLLIDECQDTSAVRLAMARRLVKAGGRVLAVGDSNQAIFSFAGSTMDSLDRVGDAFAAQRFPLTVSYRCPTSVVKVAQRFVPHMEAAASAPEGTVTAITANDFWAPAHLATLQPTDVLLCRYTKPLVDTAYRLIRAGIPCRVEGRSIGEGLLALAKRWRITHLTTLVRQLDTYKARESAKLIARGKEVAAEHLADRVDTLLAIIRHLREEEPDATVASLRGRITTLFEDADPPHGVKPPARFTLATVHRAKGGEWNKVFIWGRAQMMPSRYARRPDQLQAERCVEYVAVTRAKQDLIDVVLS